MKTTFVKDIFCSLAIILFSILGCTSNGALIQPPGDGTEQESNLEQTDGEICRDGQMRCDGSQVLICDQGKWRADRDCAEQGERCRYLGLAGAECMSPDLCISVDEPCLSDDECSPHCGSMEMACHDELHKCREVECRGNTDCVIAYSQVHECGHDGLCYRKACGIDADCGGHGYQCDGGVCLEIEPVMETADYDAVDSPYLDAMESEGWDSEYPSSECESMESGGAEDGGTDPFRDPPLMAGEWDDNENFEEFLQFLRQNRNMNGVRVLDPEGRTRIVVTDQYGMPVPNADVWISPVGGQDSVSLRTMAKGTVLFHPRAYGMSEEDDFEVVVRAGFDRDTTAMQSDPDNDFIIAMNGERVVPDRYPVDIAITLDTTGSMGDQIGQIQSTLIRIVHRLRSHPIAPDLRFALVAYRDRGDEYITQTYDFTGDIGSFQDTLNSIRAGGGGDFPESMNRALLETLRGLSWDRPDALKLVFLIADAPPHMDYEEHYEYDDAMREAAMKGIAITPITASGVDTLMEVICRQIAQFTQARYVFLTAGGYTPVVGGDEDVPEGEDAEDLPYDIHSLDDVMVNTVIRELDDLMHEWEIGGR